MKKIELTGEIDTQGNMVFTDLPLPSGKSNRVKVTIEYPNSLDEEIDLDDTPIEEVLASLKRSMQQIRAGERIPLAEIWEILAEDDTEAEAS